MKVVWLCHFSNQEILKILRPRKPINDFAPWITGLINLFELEKQVELHIVSPYEYISGIKEFELRGIYYHFFNAHMPFTDRHWPGFFKLDDWTNFYFNKRKIKKILKIIIK